MKRLFLKTFRKFAINKVNNLPKFSIPKEFTWNKPSLDDSTKFENNSLLFQKGVEHHHTANTAYPINHMKTVLPYKLTDPLEIEKIVEKSYGSIDEFGLYVHVPYCEKKCLYCEYTVCEKKKDVELEDEYIDMIGREIDLYKNIINLEEKEIFGLDIGGGTPSFLKKENIVKLMKMIHDNFNVNGGISIETTPRIASNDFEKIKLLSDLGIERISMGLQTNSEELSKKLERDDANTNNFMAVENIRNAGFEKFNIDLMYGFPHQHIEEWMKTIEYTIALDPEFITLYRMRYKGTKMASFKNNVTLSEVNEQEEIARKILIENGYNGALGKNTYSKIENDSGASKYLTARVVNGLPYLGLGLGAQSYSPIHLSYNQGAGSKTMTQYFKDIENSQLPFQDFYYLSKEASIGKFCSVAFYFGGISKRDFDNLFSESFDDYFKNEIEFLVDQKLMKNEVDYLMLTEKGKKYFGGVISQFYSPSIQKYLVDNDEKGEDFIWVEEDDILEVEEKEINEYNFGNILFSGVCNQNCPFCVGKMICDELNENNLQRYPLKNIDKFISALNQSKCKNVIMTGTTTDPQLYKYEDRVLNYLRKNIWDANISLHTNGQRILDKLVNGEYVLNMYDTCTLSLPSFKQDIFQKMTGVTKMPDLKKIMEISEIPIKISCVVNEHNVNDVDNFLQELSEIGIKRVAVRHILDDTREWNLFSNEKPVKMFYNNPVFEIYGMEVTYWNFNEVCIPSLNLFADGTISNNYLITDLNEI